MPGIGVILNPKSRRNLRDPGARERLARCVGDRGVVREARSFDELSRIASEYRKRGIDILAISGGDGTNTVTLTGFLAEYGDEPLPTLALLRGGTMNTVASSIGVRRGSPEDLLARVVAHYEGRANPPLAAIERTLLRVAPVGVDGADHGSGRVTFGFLFGTGVVQGFLAEYYTGEPSTIGAVRTLARGIGSALVGGDMIRRMAKPFHGSATLEAEPSGRLTVEWPERDYLAVAAGTVAHIGLQFAPFHRFDESANHRTFHALGIYATAAQFVGELPRVWRGVPMREGRAFDAVTARMILRAGQRTGEDLAPLRYTVDGDLHEAPAPLTASRVPSASPSAPLRASVEVSGGPRVRLLVEAER
ncbi:MAG TPA: diacylglycerol kinase family protein [Polyangiaceae bacterium]|nr:diacylglycerol kinase family protein [Polyangiaceae bacterium]